MGSLMGPESKKEPKPKFENDEFVIDHVRYTSTVLLIRTKFISP